MSFTPSGVALGAGPTAMTVAETPPEIAWLRLELELAKQGELYLVVRPERPVLEIRARGLVLDRVPLAGVVLLAWRSPGDGGADAASPAPLPRLWRVEGRAPSAARRFVAPPRLRPWEEESEEDAAPAAAPAPAAADEVPTPEPSCYTLGLEGGWELRVGQELPPRGWLPRFREALTDGWHRLRGGDRPPRPHLIVLALDPERAQAIHHLFRPGMALVVAATSPPAAPPGI